MKSTLIVCLFALFSSIGLASETDRDTLTYTGTRGNQNMSLQTQTMRTEWRWVQVPYQERVCRNETRYRRECRQEPPRRVCRTVNKPVCRIVRECRRDRNGNQVCRQRRVCRDRPVRVCRDEPGRRVCRQVPYQHRVCRTETRYRQERRAYQVVDRRTQATLNFNFVVNGNTSGINTRVDASLDRDFLTVRTEDFSSPQRALLHVRRDNRSGSGRDTYLTSNYDVTVVGANELFGPINGSLTTSEIDQGRIRFETDLITQRVDTQIGLRIVSGSVLLDRMLNPGEYRTSDLNGRTRLDVDLRSLLGADYSGRELNIEFTVSIPQNRLLNSQQFTKFSNTQSSRRIWR